VRYSRDDRGLCYVCTLTEGVLHLKAKSAKKMTCCMSVIKLININLIIFLQDLIKHYLKVVLGVT